MRVTLTQEREVELIALVLFLSVALPPQSELVARGGFEETGGGGVITVPAGESRGPWVNDGAVDVEFVTVAKAAEGSWCVDLNGVSGPGTIAQKLRTTPGRSYRITFALSGNPGAYGEHPNPKTLEVLWNGQKVGAFEYKHRATDRWDNLKWERKSVQVKGTGSDKLAFRSTTAGSPTAGPLIDDVDVGPGTGAPPIVKQRPSLKSLRCVLKRPNGVLEPLDEVIYDKAFYVEAEYEKPPDEDARWVNIQWTGGAGSRSRIVKMVRSKDDRTLYLSGPILVAPERRAPKNPRAR